MIAQTSSLAKAFVLAVASFGMFSAAFPASEMEKRAIFTPRVTYPHTGTVWYKGDAHNVTWDTSDAPVNVTNRYGGRIQLRKAELITPLILADNFDVLLGRIEVVVPFVEPGSDYSLVFFGDSGDYSDEFTILATRG